MQCEASCLLASVQWFCMRKGIFKGKTLRFCILRASWESFLCPVLGLIQAVLLWEEKARPAAQPWPQTPVGIQQHITLLSLSIPHPPIYLFLFLTVNFRDFRLLGAFCLGTKEKPQQNLTLATVLYSDAARSIPSHGAELADFRWITPGVATF